ncbi:MAG TPA: hypothetical protein VFG83_05140 [Kofleriaceae bacterium]|nr:hypothetical protein [Kofleriaceae bacterium]
MHRLSCLFLAASLLALGCGDDASEGPWDPVDAAVPDGAIADAAIADVTGTATITYVTANEQNSVPEDFSTADIEALVPGDDGAFTSYTGTGTAAGTFSIPGVPPGESFYVRVGQTYFFGDRRQLDLSYTTVGRADATYAETSPTDAVFDITAMDAWTTLDQLNFFAPAADATYTLLNADPETGDPLLSAGATALDLTVDYASADSAGVIDNTKGDVAYLVHLEGTVDENDVQTQTLSQLATFSDIHQADGEATTFAGAFEDLAKDRRVALDIRFSEFAGQLAGDVADGFGDAAIIAQPGPESIGAQFGAAELVDVSPTATNDDAMVTVDYGNPFPSTWSLYGDVFQLATVQLTTASGIDISKALFAGQSDTLAAFTAGPIQPLVTPISAPTLDGQDATAALSGLSLTPTLSWTAADGANGYLVTIYHVVADTDSASAFRVADIYTTATEIIVPPGVLTAGDEHFMVISAVAEPNTDLAATPFADSFPSGYVDVITALFVVGDAAPALAPIAHRAPATTAPPPRFDRYRLRALAGQRRPHY